MKSLIRFVPFVLPRLVDSQSDFGGEQPPFLSVCRY